MLLTFKQTLTITIFVSILIIDDVIKSNSLLSQWIDSIKILW